MTNNTKTKPLDLLLQARIESKIYLIRGRRVMLDRDLAELYEVTTGNLNKAVKRNTERFPSDFMFQLNKKEIESLMFQMEYQGRWEEVEQGRYPTCLPNKE